MIVVNIQKHKTQQFNEEKKAWKLFNSIFFLMHKSFTVLDNTPCRKCRSFLMFISKIHHTWRLLSGSYHQKSCLLLLLWFYLKFAKRKTIRGLNIRKINIISIERQSRSSSSLELEPVWIDRFFLVRSICVSKISFVQN